MAIYRLLREASFGPDEIERMTTAYETALKLLRLTDRTDPLTELIAQKIVETARNGARDPVQICTLALAGLGIPLPE